MLHLHQDGRFFSEYFTQFLQLSRVVYNACNFSAARLYCKKTKKEERKEWRIGVGIVEHGINIETAKEGNKSEQSVVLHAFRRDRTYTRRIFHCTLCQKILYARLFPPPPRPREKVCSESDGIYLHSFLRGLIFPSFFSLSLYFPPFQFHSLLFFFLGFCFLFLRLVFLSRVRVLRMIRLIFFFFGRYYTFFAFRDFIKFSKNRNINITAISYRWRGNDAMIFIIFIYHIYYGNASSNVDQ